MKDVEAATKGMGDAEKASALQSTFTADSIKGLNLILNAGVDEAAGFEEELRKSGGTAKEMAEIMQNNLGGDLTNLGSKFEGVQIAIYEKFEPALRAGVKMLDKLLDGVNFVIDHSSEFIAVIGGMAAGIGAYVAYTTALKVMKEGWMALTVVQKAVTAAQWLMNTAMAANPIGIVVAAIAALVAAFIVLWKTNDKFRKGVLNVWKSIKTGITTAIKTIYKVITTAWGIIKKVTSTVWDGIKTVIITVLKVLGTIFKTYVNIYKTIITTGFNLIKTVVTTIWNAIKTVTSTVWNAIKTAITTVVNAIKTTVTTVVNAIKSTITTVWNAIKTTTSTVWNAIKTAVTTPINAAKSAVSTTINGIKSTVSSVWNSIKSTTSTVWNNIKSAITKPIESAKNTVKSVINKIKDFFPLKLGKIFTGLKLPHFKITNKGKFPFGILGKGSLPKWDVSWYAKGGVIDGASVIGVGEDGAEAVVPLERNTKWIKRVADDLRTELALNRSQTADVMAQQIDYDSAVDAFKEALSEMKIILDDDVAGKFIEKTVTRIIYT
jgi:phage-related protein